MGNMKSFNEVAIDIIKTLDFEEKPIENLFLPCFQFKKENEDLSWMKGFCVEKEKAYIHDGACTTDVIMDKQKPHEGALSFDPTDKDVVVSDDFYIVMSHTVIQENIDVPFAFGCVKKQSWIY